MYQVLIADDEASVLEGLQEAIDWASLDMEVAACVRSGRDALREMESRAIDIAILDIRMPGINGLETCAALRRKSEQLQIIMISGYAEFSYAEKAIEYGVIGYCLKPLDYDKMKRCLRKAAANLDHTVRKATEENLLDAIDARDAEKISRAFAQAGFREPGCFMAVTAGEENLPPRAGRLALGMGRNLRLYLADEPFSEEERRTYLREEGNLGLGWLPGRIAAADLRRMMKRCAIQACQYFFSLQETGCCRFEEAQANALIQSVTDLAARERWDLVLMQLRSIGSKHAEDFNIRTAQKLWNAVHGCSLFCDSEMDNYIDDYRQLIVEYGSFRNMVQQICMDIQRAQEKSGGSEYTNTAFMKLLSYIGEHYRGDISLADAGQALHMNPNYVSQLFKKEAGETFTHYVTQLRMDDAIRLLTTTDLPVVEIAMESGFNDYFYFLKVFKRMTNRTPSQYRQDKMLSP